MNWRKGRGFCMGKGQGDCRLWWVEDVHDLCGCCGWVILDTSLKKIVVMISAHSICLHESKH